ncbi:uncharacterized protein LOC113239241 [Hyposmocoma kahamanoa]|uniref:uncharacterized protein LOC113239241 n=1 Tax=Hyposmocoma kahamanoa TaxID=1477025 RepID=UPI000E6D829F|nr:uncharacterized protein LOC113239241 [Hyposmocoma kahamanoa]
MTDTNSFTSLLALVDSHLSKTKVSESRSENGNGTRDPFPIPSIGLSKHPQTGTVSDTTLSFSPEQRLPIPRFMLGESPIQSVLNEQVANMLKAKELRRQQEEEKQRLAEQMKKMTLQEDDDVIDLMQALQKPWDTEASLQPMKEQTLSSSSSFESLFAPKFDSIDLDDVSVKDIALPEPKLPCKTDMSYILFQKFKRGKCSAFGRVLSAKVKPVAAPYLHEKIQHNIKVFDFSTPSPDDIIKEKRSWKPACNASYTPDIVGFI